MSPVSDARTLVLLRHAKTEQIPVGSRMPDHDRELTHRGRLDAQAAGGWLRDNGIVADVVLCSTSVRTRQTWDQALRGGARAELVELRRAVYEGGTSGVLDTVREDGGDARTVLVVGHGPSVPELAGGLTDGRGSADAHAALAHGFPTAGLAVLRYEGEWPELAMETASLERFHVCRG